MTVAAFAFYAFSVIMVVSALMMTISRNPVHAVLWLILTFVCASGLMVLLGAEFIAMIMLMIYVGAVAVLFLFVVMMLDINFETLKGEMAKAAPLGILIAVVLIMQIIIGIGVWTASPDATALHRAPTPEGIENTRALGLVLYDKYILLFEVAGLILLTAMIGAILLTMRHRTGIRRQRVLSQIWREPSDTLELKDVKPGQGL